MPNAHLEKSAVINKHSLIIKSATQKIAENKSGQYRQQFINDFISVNFYLFVYIKDLHVLSFYIGTSRNKFNNKKNEIY